MRNQRAKCQYCTNHVYRKGLCYPHFLATRQIMCGAKEAHE